MTIRNLAKYLKKSESSLYHMRKNHPKQFELLWMGWTAHNLLKKQDIKKRNI